MNLALGPNATNFNISIVELFNQTGAGLFCLKDAGRANLEEGFRAAGYSGLEDERINGLLATVQVIQLGHAGSALYNVSFKFAQFYIAWFGTVLTNASTVRRYTLQFLSRAS